MGLDGREPTPASVISKDTLHQAFLADIQKAEAGGFFLSRGQAKLIDQLTEALSVKDNRPAIIGIRGISGSGKSAVFDVVDSSLKRFSVHNIGDADPHEYLKQHPEAAVVIHTAQIDATPSDHPVWDYRGFTPGEVQARLAFSITSPEFQKATSQYLPPQGVASLDPDRMLKIMKNETPPTETESKV